jgi:phytoene dehydrogenase-like protein
VTGAARKPADVIVVGAGHNGLVCAGYLARAGLDVVVLEQREQVGGLCGTVEIIPGVRGNVCANSAHNLEPKVIEDLQLESHGLMWSETLSPSSFITFPNGRRIVSWDDATQLRDELERLAPGEFDAYVTMFEDMAELGVALDVSYFDAPPTLAAVAAKPKTRAQEELFGEVMFGSVGDLVDRRLSSEEARASISMLGAGGNFVGPLTPGSAFQLMGRALYRGGSVVRERPKVRVTADFNTRHAVGGMGAITASMANSLRAAGGTIRTQARVRQIKADTHGVSGVVLESGEELDARIVVSAINPKRTLVELVPSDAVPGDLRNAYESLAMNGSMAKVYLVLDDLPRFACARDDAENAALNRCGFRTASTVENMHVAFERARQGDWSGEPMLYGLTQTAYDPTLAPEGTHVMSVTAWYAPYEIQGSWSEQGDAWARHVIRHLADHITNLDSIVTDYRYLTPADIEDEFGLLEANALHGDVVVHRMFNWRPIAGFSDYTTPVERLYLCSNGTWPAVYVSGLPGHNAAHKILHDRRGSSRSGARERAQAELAGAGTGRRISTDPTHD